MSVHASELLPFIKKFCAGVYIGGLEALDFIECLAIRRVVSALNQPHSLSHPLLETCDHYCLDLEDDSEADLITKLPGAIDFISSGPGPVLIHCAQGVSRSAAVAVAFLMQTKHITAEEALCSVQSIHASALPNEGFLQQLKLYDAMNCDLDQSHLPYRQHLLRQTGRHYVQTGRLSPDALAAPSDTVTMAATSYRCRKCRSLVATSENVVDVAPGPGEAAFPHRKRDSNVSKHPSSSLDGGSLFVQPLQWMSAVVIGADTHGKLYCPTCSSRLGAFDWSGAQSSSGAWVTPAFRLHLARLDVDSPLFGLLPEIKQPRLLRSNKTQSEGFTHLILDCDGVMVDSEMASCESLYLALLEVTGFSIPHVFPDDFVPVFGMDVFNCILYYQDRFNSQKWGDPAVVAERVTTAKKVIYEKLTAQRGIKAFAGVSQLIHQARGLGLGVAVASSGSPAKIRHNLESSGLLHFFQGHEHLLVSAEYVARGKPAPDVYLEALSRVRCENPARAIVIEDAVNGLVAAKAAGCFAIGITNQLPWESLAEHADLVVDTVDDIDLGALATKV